MPLQRWSERIWVAQLSEDPVFAEDIEALVRQADGGPMPDLVLDLSGVAHMNSANLSQLLKLRKRAVDADARLRLAGPPDHVWALFITTGLDKVFEFTPDTTTALAHLQMGR